MKSSIERHGKVNVDQPSYCNKCKQKFSVSLDEFRKHRANCTGKKKTKAQLAKEAKEAEKARKAAEAAAKKAAEEKAAKEAAESGSNVEIVDDSEEGAEDQEE